MTKRASELTEILREIDRLIQSLQKVATQSVGDAILSRPIRERVEAIEARINDLVVTLDPVRRPTSVFDPAHPAQIGRFVALALLAQPREPLSDVGRFYGAGVYGIYYSGPFRPYSRLSGKEHPIYIGKADPIKTDAATPKAQGMGLHRRLAEHARSIGLAKGTLKVEQFTCRYLVVQSGWQTAAEDYLIELFKPIWNNEQKLLYGIGKHGDKAETRGNKRSPWDTLHPGRRWAKTEILADQKERPQIIKDLAEHFRIHPPYATMDAIIRDFMSEMRQS